MNSIDYQIKMSSDAINLISLLSPMTVLEAQEFKRKHRLYAEKYGLNQVFDKNINEFVELCKTFRNCFNNYLTKIHDLIKSRLFLEFIVFRFKHNLIKEEILKNFINITKDLDNIRNELHFGYNFEELLKNLIEIIYNGFEGLFKDIEKYEQKLKNNRNETELSSELTEEKNNKSIINNHKILEEFWKNIPNFVIKFGFYYTEHQFISFEEKYGMFLNTGLENSYGVKSWSSGTVDGLNLQRISKLGKIKIKSENELNSKPTKIINQSKVDKELEECEPQMKSREQKVIEFKKNIRDRKELFERFSSGTDRYASELKLSTVLKDEINSENVSESKPTKIINQLNVEKEEIEECEQQLENRKQEMFEIDRNIRVRNELLEELKPSADSENEMSSEDESECKPSEMAKPLNVDKPLDECEIQLKSRDKPEVIELNINEEQNKSHPEITPNRFPKDVLLKQLEINYLRRGEKLKNKRQELLEIDKNIRNRKELFEKLRSGTDRYASDLKLSTVLRDEMNSENESESKPTKIMNQLNVEKEEIEECDQQLENTIQELIEILKGPKELSKELSSDRDSDDRSD